MATATATATTNIRVRPFTEGDGLAVTQLWVDGLQQTVDNLWPVAVSWVSHYVFQRETEHVISEQGDLGPQGSNISKTWMGMGDRTFFVATLVDTAEVVGCCGVRKTQTIGQNVMKEWHVDFSSAKTASVLRLTVAEKHRRKGIATLLIREAEDWAREKGCDSLWLNSANPRALEFFRSIGYDSHDWTGLRLFKKLAIKNNDGKEYLARKARTQQFTNQPILPWLGEF